MATSLNKLKHLQYFKNYIAEQDFAADPAAAPVAAAPKEPRYKFIFIEDSDKDDVDYTYPNGSSSKKFDTYEISKTELDDWLDGNVISTDSAKLAKSAIDVKKKAVSEYIAGTKLALSPADKEFINKFKNSVTSDINGKKVQSTEVTYTPDGEVSSDLIDVTFITIEDES